MTNYWRPYTECIPPEQHIQSKAETFTVEGYNSLFRHFLARQSKCSSKSLLMLEYSVKLLMLKWNKELYILN
jgi:insertion element IS1 protein InsB